MAKDITVEAKMTAIHIPIEGVMLTDGFQPFMSNIYRNWKFQCNNLNRAEKNFVLLQGAKRASINIKLSFQHDHTAAWLVTSNT